MVVFDLYVNEFLPYFDFIPYYLLLI